MNYFKLFFGIFLVVCGIGSLYAYVTKNEKMFWKKKPMIDFWGEKWGTRLHFTSYVIVPLILGPILIYISFFE